MNWRGPVSVRRAATAARQVSYGPAGADSEEEEEEEDSEDSEGSEGAARTTGRRAAVDAEEEAARQKWQDEADDEMAAQLAALDGLVGDDAAGSGEESEEDLE